MIRILALLCCLPFAAWANNLPDAALVPGGIAVLPIASITAPPPKAFYNGHRVLVAKDQDSWVAVVGIPLNAALGNHAIDVESNGVVSPVSFHIADKDYPEQRLKISNKRMVDEMTAEDLKRIEAEKQEMARIKAVWSERDADTAFRAPVDGRLSSLFGLKRFFNDVPRQPHNGLDIADGVGARISAPASGQVIGTGNYFFNGNTVFVDHGQGLISAYLHMSRIDVQTGQHVKQGDKLGEVGATGRVTGPHLHWIVYLNQETIDPALFIGSDIPRLAARNKP